MKTDDYIERMKGEIVKNGRCVISVINLHAPAFSYTVGNVLRGLPELLVFGLHAHDSAQLLNNWSRIMTERDRAFDDGELVRIIEDARYFPVKAVRCSGAARDFTLLVDNLNGAKPYDVMQMLVPDKLGRFPGDPACASPYADVPVLGISPAVH